MSTTTDYDLIVLGAGPGGYACALRAAQHGLKTAIVERDRIGGVCLNRGCIPTKVLLQAAGEMRAPARAARLGVDLGKAGLDVPRLMQRKGEIIKWLTSGVEALLYKRHVDVFFGAASLAEEGMVAIDGADGHKVIRGSNRVIATGSSERGLPGMAIDGRVIIGSTEALQLDSIPGRMAIIGAGAVGAEFASAFADFGSEVTLIEALPRILPLEDEECAAVVATALQKKGVRVLTAAPVRACTVGESGAAISCETGGALVPVAADKVLVAVGRRPNTDGLGLERLGVKTARGYVVVDEDLRSGAPGVFAIGDCVLTPALAHVATAEGKYVADLVAGARPPRLRYDVIPKCTFTDPEVASVGLTETEARGRGLEISVARFPMRANGKAAIYGELEGLVKMVCDAATGQVLGVHIAGHGASELIAEAALAMSLEATAGEIAYTIHAHPTVSESVLEAAEAVLGLDTH
ncbi:MAG: dihydrolipoyl dehydrogenase [Anaerolineae bacterium]